MQLAGIIYSEERKKSQAQYQEAIERAHFLDKKEKEHWAILGYILTTEQLKEASHLIIDEDLRRLATHESLERMKPNPTQTYV